MGRVKRTTAVLIAAGLAAVIALGFAAMHVATGIYMADGRARAEATLGLTLQALDGHLRRYESVPDLLADSDAVRALMDAPAPPPRM